MTEQDFDTQLQRQLQARPEPPDDGFNLRVMAALPRQRSRRQVRLRRALRAAASSAMVLAALALAALPQLGLPSIEQALATAALLALLLWWSLPQSPGSVWR